MRIITQSKNYQFFKTRKIFNQISLKIFRYTIYILAFLALVIVALDFFKFWQVSGYFIGIAYIVIALSLFLINLELFVSYGLFVRNKKSFSSASGFEIVDFLDQGCLEVFDEYINLLKKYKIRCVNFGMFIFALKKTTKGKYFLIRSGLVLSEEVEKNFAKKIVNSKQDKDSMDKNIINLLEMIKTETVTRNQNRVGFRELVLALYESNTFIMHIFSEINLKKEDIEQLLNWQIRAFEESKKMYFWQKNYYNEGIGRDWAAGYTPTLNLYATDISQYLGDVQLDYQSRSRVDLLQEMEDVLARSGKNNVLIVGDPGVGKKTLVNALSQKIIRGQSYNNLNYKHIVQLDIGKIMSGSVTKSEIQARFNNILYDAHKAGNIIVYINNLSTLLGSPSDAIGQIDASEYLYPYLESGVLQVVASITYEDYKNRLQANTSLESLFSMIRIEPLTKEEVMSSIEYVIVFIEARHKVVFTYQSVKKLVELADRYIHNEPFPQKAVDLLSEVAIRNEKSGRILVVEEDVESLIQEKTHTPVGKVETVEKEKLLNLESILHERVVGQDEAISVIANSLRRSRAGLSRKNKPIGTFLFIGPTGVGKTETAKTLAENYYQSEAHMIRFDMSEFQQINSIDQLIGNKVGREFIPGRLTQSVQNNPYSLVLLDEIEKAHPNILNLFLQILDEGKVTDAAGRAVDFTDTIIIATSNAGSEKIRQYLKQGMKADELGKVIVDSLLKEGIFKPEFINRFDKVVCYKPLEGDEVLQVIRLMLKKVEDSLSQKQMRLEIDEKAIEKLAREGYDPVFGARPLQRIIQEKVENMLATKILSGELQEGQIVKITQDDV